MIKLDIKAGFYVIGQSQKNVILLTRQHNQTSTFYYPAQRRKPDLVDPPPKAKTLINSRVLQDRCSDRFDIKGRLIMKAEGT